MFILHRIDCKSKPSVLTNKQKSYIIHIEKGKTSNGYAKSVLFKNNATFDGGRYFFMVNAKISNKININVIM